MALELWAGGLFLIVAVAAYVSAWFRPLWYDEIFTGAVARLGSPARIWDALAHAMDTNPPLYYMLAAYGRSLPVSDEVGLRLASLIGFLVFVGSVVFFVWRAFGPLSCVVAAAFLASSETLHYGSEARPYGAVLGALGLAALLWQYRKQGRAPRATLVFLILCLVAASSLHYYGVLGVMTFGLAEVLAGIRIRKLDWPLLLALPLALIPTLIMLPLIKAAARDFGGAFAARASLKSIAAAYVFTFSSPQLPAITLVRLHSGREIPLGQVFLLPVLILAACGMVWRWRKTHKPLTWPRTELLLAFAFLLLPLAAGLAAMMSSGIFSFRYTLASTLGAAVLSGWLLPAWNRNVAYGMAAVLTLALIRNEVPGAFHKLSALASGETPGDSENQRLAPLFRMMDSGASVVIANGILYMEIFHYASPKYRNSLLYLVDTESAVRFSGSNTIDHGLLNLQPYEGLRLQLAPDFLRANREFLLLSTGRDLEWLPAYLRQRNARFQTIERMDATDSGMTGASTLSRVQLP